MNARHDYRVLCLLLLHCETTVGSRFQAVKHRGMRMAECCNGTRLLGYHIRAASDHQASLGTRPVNPHFSPRLIAALSPCGGRLGRAGPEALLGIVQRARRAFCHRICTLEPRGELARPVARRRTRRLAASASQLRSRILSMFRVCQQLFSTCRAGSDRPSRNWSFRGLSVMGKDYQ